ncbi:MAG TPA: quinoprotein dehydrogenase-associated putative ABC transporter substrate-binding protein [Steroidobacteraceae bacterium]
MTNQVAGLLRFSAVLSCCLAACSLARGADLKSLTVCADPGNMPLTNEKGEGFENKIAQLIGQSLGTGVQYYWRPSIERGLMRTTLSAGNCDLWMDMASDTEGAAVLKPLYRSTFVLAYRSDKNIHIKTLDDAPLKALRVGVFQVSAMRTALAEHHVVGNTVIHYLSHNGDLVESNQPSYQVQQVIDGTLDIAAAWGPMAGYYKEVVHAPLIIQPVNMMEDEVPLEFDMTLAVPRGRPDIKAAVEGAIAQHAADIKKILMDFGVPLVKCDHCTVSGNLPSHGPYKPAKPEVQSAAVTKKLRAARMADLKKWLAEGANPDDELNDAIVANDIDRVSYLMGHGAHVNSQDGEGFTPLISAIRFGFVPVATRLMEQGGDANFADRNGWTPLMWAAWGDNPALINLLIKHRAKLDAEDADGLTSLAIAAQNGKANAAKAILEAGADVNAPVAKGGYTPLMLASVAGSNELAASLIAHGAKVNASNPGGVTALMIAAAGNHAALAVLLLKSGADVNARSADGRTALSIAEASDSEAVAKMLREAADSGSKSG